MRDEQLAEVAKGCAEAIAAGRTGIVLVLRNRLPRGERMRLIAGWKGKCPLGEVLCVNADGNTIARFEPFDVLAFLVAHGVVEYRSAS